MALRLPLPSLETPTVLLRSPSQPLLPPPSSLEILPPLPPCGAALQPSPAPPLPPSGCFRRQGRDRAARLDCRAAAGAEPRGLGIRPTDTEGLSLSLSPWLAIDLLYLYLQALELLKKNRDMTFGEVKLTIMIEDPRDTERKRLLGIEDPDELNRDDLAVALEDVHEGRIPENCVALRLLAEEMIQWPDLEVEAPKKKRSKSLYAKATDIGVDPQIAAKRLNIDWDSAADIEPEDESDDIGVPPAMGYSALYLVTALPLLIGISVVLILFYNSLQ